LPINILGALATKEMQRHDEPQIHNSLVHAINKGQRMLSEKEKGQIIAVKRPSGKAPKHRRCGATSQ